MPYTLVQPEQTIDLGRDGSKWRHGWVPLNAAATAIKLKRERASGPSSAGKSRLSTSDVRPSRSKLKGAKGRSAANPFAAAVARGDIKPTGREHLGGGTHGKAAAVQSSHPIGSPVMAKQPGIEAETRGHVTGHTDAGMVKVQYKDRHGNQTVGTFNPSHTRVLTGQEAAQHDYEHGGATAKPGLKPSEQLARIRATEAERNANSVHLQSVGRHPAVKASDVKVGDTRVYNFGSTAKVTGVEHKNGMVHITHDNGTTTKHRSSTLLATRAANPEAGKTSGGMTHSGEAAFKHTSTETSGRHEGMAVYKQPNADKPRAGFKIPPPPEAAKPHSDAFGHMVRGEELNKIANVKSRAADGMSDRMGHRAERAAAHREAAAAHTAVADHLAAGPKHLADKENQRRTQAKRHTAQADELESTLGASPAKPASTDRLQQTAQDRTRRINNANVAKDEAAARKAAPAGTVPVYNVKTGKVEHVSQAEATAGHVRYGQSLGAGTPAAGQTVKNALDARPAAYSLKVNGLEGYGVTDLKRIAKLSAGPHDASHAPAGTIAAAEAELRSRGYVKSPSGAWTKPRAPKVKNTTSGLRGTNVTKREQAATGLSARKRNLVSQKDLFGRSGK